jgi:hypothetical protein
VKDTVTALYVLAGIVMAITFVSADARKCPQDEASIAVVLGAIVLWPFALASSLTDPDWPKCARVRSTRV